MRVLIAVVAALVLAGVAPVTVAAGLCAEQPCCPGTDTVRVAAPDCCGEVVCSDETRDELVRTEKANDVTLTPLKSVTAAIVRPPSMPMLASMRIPAKSGAERLSSLSILLI